MAEFAPGDVVVLKSGSMRMLVERIEGESAAVVWANDGGIGRDVLPIFALNKWEHRPDSGHGDRPAPRPRPREDGDRPARPFGGDRKGPSKPYGKPADRDGPRQPKPGMDGKPRQKTHFRKDD